ncbi:hypothetical protein FOB64_006071 [Candida albicans]|uniref:C2H2-type domain-containing protein n=1 Tax=Candida albicans TaxID=5476 RepID=A0A8H6BTK8_CANAX|nr:hypothetical protein FOB64_006071 [Candida albicans]
MTASAHYNYNRRNSSATPISEGETGRLKEELRCEACGKGYKHISSLAKHLWEHTPEWNVTKKLLISKHQQVQLLEAASILVDQYNNAPPYSPPSTSHTSDTSTTPTISHSNNQDFNGDQEQGIQFRNGYHHNEYEGEEYDDYEGQKRMDYGRSRSVSHEPPTNHSNVNGTSPW